MWVYLPSDFSPDVARSNSRLSICSVSERSATSNGSPQPSPCYEPASLTDACTTRPYGTTCAPFLPTSSVDESTWCVAAFPASRSASPERDEQAPTSATDGPQLATSFARYDLGSRSWRTSQACLPGVMGTSDEYSESWPKAGSMSSGECYPRKPWGGLTGESDFGYLLPTPTASTYGSNQGGQNPGPPRYSLEAMAAKGMLPTCTVNDARNVSGASQLKRHSPGLSTMATFGMLGEPGLLNPQFREWMMGMPIGFTALEPLATQSFQSWLQLHGIYFKGGTNE